MHCCKCVRPCMQSLSLANYKSRSSTIVHLICAMDNLEFKRTNAVEWLADKLVPEIEVGLQVIFDEALDTAKTTNEGRNYLKVFQTLLLRVGKWNPAIINAECDRIKHAIGRNDLEDLITYIHVIHVRMLTDVRLTGTQKSVSIDIPKLPEFIHAVYRRVATAVYSTSYLFEINTPSIRQQECRHNLRHLIRDCISMVIRESVPIDSIMQACLAEAVEEDVTEEIKEEFVPVSAEDAVSASTVDSPIAIVAPVEPLVVNAVATPPISSTSVDKKSIRTASSPGLSFNNMDSAIDVHGQEEHVNAPKDFDALEIISQERTEQRRQEAKQMQEEEDAEAAAEAAEAASNSEQSMEIDDGIELTEDDEDLGIEILL